MNAAGRVVAAVIAVAREQVHRCEHCGKGPIAPCFKLCGRCAQIELADDKVNDRALYAVDDSGAADMNRGES